MRTEIIAVGTELLLGQIANTNAQWISKKLAKYGAPVYFHGVVGDNMERAIKTFEVASERSDVIIVTGGLGPTEDDLTRDAVKPLLKQNLVIHENTLAKIESVYRKNNRQMTTNNRKQALVFEHASVLANAEGMAPGQLVKHDQTLFVFLPGVPSEMKSLMEEHVLPYLIDVFQLESEIVSEMLRFIGIGESTLEHKLEDIIKHQQDPTIAPLAAEGEVGLRLTASGANAKAKIAALKADVLQRVGRYYYGSDDMTIEEKVRDLLKAKGMTLGSAESLTGGKFIERLIALPGASAVCEGGLVAYTAQAKESVIGVSADLIKQHGTISEECAKAMATQAQKRLSVEAAISFTGVAGPDNSEGQEPGVVYIALQIGGQDPIVERHHFEGGRDNVRTRAVKKGYEIIFHHLKK
ncbi:competence/damage-inducible protein A [Halobacillus shinanisalinarum]|uniref:Putative competence-damage inducible protein n=1 Tax=Halobacillus shinanisalinarum TaxID=2932258 RepID=A0ABY4GZH3_9BACI|nr:competence/damage-inducible protein A [Halobacillus shinanisalinarum]UOQ93284.1 competence/damage-inducible protein A [Halobacillus shinanisalinarum]